MKEIQLVYISRSNPFETRNSLIINMSIQDIKKITLACNNLHRPITLTLSIASHDVMYPCYVGIGV